MTKRRNYTSEKVLLYKSYNFAYVKIRSELNLGFDFLQILDFNQFSDKLD